MLAACFAFGACGPAVAGELVLGGLTFSDELGGVELHAGWGSGTLDDPFVLVEAITGRGPAVLVVRGLSPRFGNRIRSQHATGFALIKIVHNRTRTPWSLFEIELREHLERPSPYGDGLSFGQGTTAGRPFRADRFAAVDEIFEPYDAVIFSGGMVAPGESVRVELVVTDTTPHDVFYLLQRRDSPLAAIATGRPRAE